MRTPSQLGSGRFKFVQDVTESKIAKRAINLKIEFFMLFLVVFRVRKENFFVREKKEN
jgi:hypothetical protein